jgi:bifunctional DNA-binding transcriptional regulator/antitoxin component of YhaV-PrlF toxin-antitoxin module
MYPPPPQESPAMTDFIRSWIADAGRVVIPAEFRKALGVEVLISRDDHGLRITTLRDAIRQAQDYFASLARPEVRLSEELLRDRREEAARGD